MHGVQDLLFPNMKYHYHGQDGNYNYKITSDSYVIVKKTHENTVNVNPIAIKYKSSQKKFALLHYYLALQTPMKYYNMTNIMRGRVRRVSGEHVDKALKVWNSDSHYSLVEYYL